MSKYAFISREEYNKNHKAQHPTARASPDGLEVVISTNHHSLQCNCVTEEVAIKYIEDSWGNPKTTKE